MEKKGKETKMISIEIIKSKNYIVKCDLCQGKSILLIRMFNENTKLNHSICQFCIKTANLELNQYIINEDRRKQYDKV